MVSKQEFNPGFQFGTYTGDGAATLAITGLGFQPKKVMIYPQVAGVTSCLGLKCSDDGLFAFIQRNNGLGNPYEVDHIISLDVDGFTVGDGTGGTANFMNLARDYVYQAFAEGN